jgi:hypothetical protein
MTDALLWSWVLWALKLWGLISILLFMGTSLGWSKLDRYFDKDLAVLFVLFWPFVLPIITVMILFKGIEAAANLAWNRMSAIGARSFKAIDEYKASRIKPLPPPCRCHGGCDPCPRDHS